MVNSRMDRTQSDVREMEEIDLLELFRAILKHIKLGLTSNLVTLL